MGHAAVQAVGGVDVLAQQAEGGLCDRERVERVHPELRKGGGVRGLSGVAHLQVGAGERRELLGVDRRRVRHHREVLVGEPAALEQQDLPAAVLLGRRPDDSDGETDLIGDPRRSQRGAERHRRDHVVAAGVADARQRIVLGAERDMERAVSLTGPERGVQPAEGLLDREACVSQEPGAPGGRLLLLEREFGMCVDPVAQVHQRRAPVLDRFTCRGLRIHTHRPPGAEDRGKGPAATSVGVRVSV